MAIVVQNSMMTYQPSLEFQASLGLRFVVDVKGLDELQLTLAEPRSQPPVPPVGLPSLSGWPCLPPSSLVMPLVVKLYENQKVLQGRVFWMAELLVHKGCNWVMRLFVAEPGDLDSLALRAEPRDVGSLALHVESRDLGGEALRAERRDLDCLSLC